MFEKDTKDELARGNEYGGASSQTCESAAYIPMTVSTPISLEPIIRQLPITVSICKEPVLEQTPCGKYILMQELSVKVPIEISVRSNIEETSPCCECMPRKSNRAIPIDEDLYWGRYSCSWEDDL